MHNPEFHAVATFVAVLFGVLLFGVLLFSALVALAVAGVAMREARSHDQYLDDLKAKAMPLCSDEPKDEA